MEGRQRTNNAHNKAIYARLSVKLKKIIEERDPENVLETLEKCANIVKFSHHKFKPTQTEEENE